MSSSGLGLAGSLSITQATLNAVGDSLDLTLSAEVQTTARPSADNTANFTYYIQSDYDINSEISYHATSTVAGEDDAYSMNAITVTNSTASNAQLNLPAASGKTVDAGLISALDVDNTSLGSFPVVLTVAVSSVGRMTSTIAITGSTLTASTSENPALAQNVYWSGIDPLPNQSASAPDDLTQTLTIDQLDEKYSSEKTAINNNYNGQDMISGWTISVSAVTQRTNNALSQHARYNNKNGSTTIFAAGEKLVCATPASYSVSIDDYSGSSTTIIGATDVYGVLRQSA